MELLSVHEISIYFSIVSPGKNTENHLKINTDVAGEGRAELTAGGHTLEEIRGGVSMSPGVGVSTETHPYSAIHPVTHTLHT